MERNGTGLQIQILPGRNSSNSKYDGKWMLGPRAGLSVAKEARGKAATSLSDEKQSGRCGI